jgi:hypothetical protein
MLISFESLSISPVDNFQSYFNAMLNLPDVFWLQALRSINIVRKSTIMFNTAFVKYITAKTIKGIFCFGRGKVLTRRESHPLYDTT